MSFGRWVALLACVLSMGTIAITYWVATAQGTAPLCNPFVDGCTDITHTGMKGDAGFIFRGGMIASCVVFIGWWLCMRAWLTPVSSPKALNWMVFFGILAAVGLLAGTAVLLPSKDATHWAVHVRGANLFFQGMLIALTINYVLLWRARRRGFVVPTFAFKSGLIAVMWFFTIAFAGVTVGIEMSHGKRIIEWWTTGLIGLYFLSAFWDWRDIRLVNETASEGISEKS